MNPRTSQGIGRSWYKYGTLCMDSDKNVLSITRYDNYTQMIADDC